MGDWQADTAIMKLVIVLREDPTTDLSSAAGLLASSVPRQNPSVSPPSGLMIAVKTRASTLSLTN